MPVHDLGYRSWDGDRVPRFLRPWVVAKSGIALVWRRKWLRMMLLLAWLPICFPALGIFVFEYSSTDRDLSQMIRGALHSPLFAQHELAELATEDPDQARHQVWSSFILAFFRYPQAIAMVLLVGLIAPMMITYDLRSKAYLMYFSRPLTPAEYILGKSAVIWFFLIMISTLPALGVYVLGVFLSPGLWVVGETWDIPLRIIGASVVLLVPTTALALCYSAITTENRYATFSWFATWAMGGIAYRILTFAGAPPRMTRRGDNEPLPDWNPGGVAGQGFGPPRGGSPGRGSRRGRWMENPEFQEYMENLDLDKWRAISPYDTLGKVQASVFNLDTTPGNVWTYWALLTVATLLCLWIIRSRIVARLSV